MKRILTAIVLVYLGYVDTRISEQNASLRNCRPLAPSTHAGRQDLRSAGQRVLIPISPKALLDLWSLGGDACL